MSAPVRRVVMGYDLQGRAIVVGDGPSARRSDNLCEPELVLYEEWNQKELPARIDRSRCEQGGNTPYVGAPIFAFNTAPIVHPGGSDRSHSTHQRT